MIELSFDLHWNKQVVLFRYAINCWRGMFWCGISASLYESELFQCCIANILQYFYKLWHAGVSIGEEIVKSSIKSFKRVVCAVHQFVVIVVVNSTIDIPVLRWISHHPRLDEVFPKLVQFGFLPSFVNFTPDIRNSFEIISSTGITVRIFMKPFFPIIWWIMFSGTWNDNNLCLIACFQWNRHKMAGALGNWCLSDLMRLCSKLQVNDFAFFFQSLAQMHCCVAW